MKTTNKKARFLHQESREYRGLHRVRDYKTRANRVERRAGKQQLKVADLACFEHLKRG
jgi:hypothetical protein